jgi:hypothetical protein
LMRCPAARAASTVLRPMPLEAPMMSRVGIAGDIPRARPGQGSGRCCSLDNMRRRRGADKYLSGARLDARYRSAACVWPCAFIRAIASFVPARRRLRAIDGILPIIYAGI